MLGRYINITFLCGTLRACAIMSTPEYSRRHEDSLVIDKIGKCLGNGLASIPLWPLMMYADARNLEVYLRKMNRAEHGANTFLFFD
jgi:hypothetical protein